MDRKYFCVGAASATVASTIPVRASQIPVGPGTRAYVQQPSMVFQTCPLDCWAAACSMIFASHHHPVNQARIIQRVFGTAVCVSSGNTRNIAAALSGHYIDDRNVSFTSTVVAAYDALNGITAINNQIIVSELVANNPLLYGNTHHAMVVVAVDYLGPATAPNVQGVAVLDPMQGLRNLSQAEMRPTVLGGQMMFLAAVHVT